MKCYNLWVREDYVKKLLIHASKRGVLLTKLLEVGLSEIVLTEEIYKRPLMNTKLNIPVRLTRIFQAMGITDSKLRAAITHVALEKLVYKLQYAPESIRCFGDKERVIRDKDGLGALFKRKQATRCIRTVDSTPEIDALKEDNATHDTSE